MPLGNNTEILQIAATDGSEDFNVYVLPQHRISPAASAVNKLTFLHGTLFYDGRPVTALSISDALKEFVSWLRTKAPCMLLAHNAKSFDAKHLMRTPWGQQLVKGFQRSSPGILRYPASIPRASARTELVQPTKSGQRPAWWKLHVWRPQCSGRCPNTIQANI